MRLLFFAYYFPPLGGMGSIRALGFARWLPEFGVEVTVVAPRTGTYAHDPSLEVPAGCAVVRTGTLEPGVLLRPSWRTRGASPPPARPPEGFRAAARRAAQWLLHVPDPNVGWVPAAILAGLRAAARRRPDAVFSSSPPLSAHLAAAAVAAHLGVPHVADVRDFPHSQRLFGGLRARVDYALEDRVFRRMAGVCSPSAGILDHLAGRTSARALLVRNGYDEEDFAGPAPAPPADAFRIVHVGSTYGRYVEHGPLLRAIRDLANAGRPVRLRFVGVVDPVVRDAIRREGVEALVELPGFVDHARAIAELRGANAILLAFWGEGESAEKTVVVGKTFECLRAGRAVLALGKPGGEGARLLAELGAGTFRSFADGEGIRETLADFVAGRAPPAADPARLLPYTRREQARRLAEWLSGLVGSSR